jgi:hypothetical protein
MGLNMRGKLARDKFGTTYGSLATGQEGSVDAVVINQIKTNRYDAVNGIVSIGAAITIVVTSSPSSTAIFK